MKRILIAFIAAFAALAACQDPFQEPVQDPQENENGGNVQDPEPEIPEILDAREVTIEAGILTKTVLNGNEVKWEETDKIALVFYHSENAEMHHVNKSFAIHELKNDNANATFKGQIPNSVSTQEGYNNIGYAVYPHDAIIEGGVFSHNLPSEQTALENGSFASNLNLSSAALALDELGDTKAVKSDFRNALSVLKVKLSPDIESVTLTGSAALAGVAPLKMYYNESEAAHADNGRLMVDAEGNFDNAVKSVTLLPPAGSDFIEWTKENNFRYSILVWPGVQEQLTITVNYKNLGEYVKPSSKAVTFEPAKYYNLNFNNTEELVVEEITGKLEGVENKVPDLDDLEANVEALLDQVQSISLMTEYLDNAVFASYAQMTYSKQKINITLDYIVKPESAAEALVAAFNQDRSVVSALLGYGKGAGLEIQEQPLAVTGLLVKDVAGVGKVVTATVDASSIDNKFYDGDWDASVALQIASGKTDMLSDFANLVPKAGSVIAGYNQIPAIPGARVEIPFSYAVSGDASYTLAVTASQGVAGTSMNYYDNSKTGNLTVSFEEGAIQSPSVTLTLTVGEGDAQEVISHDFTFVDNGSRINFVDPGQVDYIGGEVNMQMNNQNIQSYSLSCSGEGISQSSSIFTFSQNNNANPRTATVECQATISGVSFSYYKSIDIPQKAYGTSLDRTYYNNGQKVVLNQANASGCSNYFNIVILGDGYQKRDLVAGGKFERSARSAMDSFFAIEPYKTFKERFNVYMVAYESVDEGTDIDAGSIKKDTYFNSYCAGGNNTAAYLRDGGEDKVIDAVKAAVGSGDATYYRSIAILLINTDEQSGSTGYPFRAPKDGWPNGYASFAIAALAANSTGTNGLIKHEAGGHAFGRLADEYYTNGTTASSANKSELSDWHAKGWYWNVNPTNSGNYYKFTNSDYSSEISYIEGAWSYQYGIYRPTQGGMMQGSTGVFNAPCRHAIYHRIITESQGASAYSWSNFKNYDQRNR